MIEAYPLYWPDGYPRAKQKKDSRFTTTLGAARDFVKDEVKRLKGTHLVISTNIPLKNNGELRASWASLDDTGAAVYFMYNGNQVCLCCDTYKKVWDNLKAIGRTIEALRQIDRDGVSDFLNRAFTGFKALPESTTHSESCWDILGIKQTKDENAIYYAYRALAKIYHPDMPRGDADKMKKLTDAYKKAMNLSKK